MRYLTPDLIKAYERADKDERKRMCHAILEAWDAEYQNLVSCGVTPDTVWSLGRRPIDEIPENDGADEHR